MDFIDERMIDELMMSFQIIIMIEWIQSHDISH